MDHLWTPWRYQYVSGARAPTGCIFCVKAAEGRDAENYIVYRGELNFVLLNLYPYTAGHMMIAPYQHVATLEQSPTDVLLEMMLLAQRAEINLRAVYRPDGVNIGLNIGASAGAGVAGHIHMHVVARWSGDANFMTTIAETRVMPEDLSTSYQKLAKMAWTEQEGKRQEAKGKRQK
jgi:ATP adenylyltransferase